MILDDYIKYCEEVSKLNEECARSYNEQDEILASCSCKACADEHRQLAEWLRELKAYKKAEKEIEQELVNWDDIDNGKCRGLFLATSIIQHYKDEEVNADE